MAAGHDANVHDDHGHDAPLQDHPDHETATHGGRSAADTGHPGPGAADRQSDHGGHDDHGSGGDSWVVPPLLVGVIIAIVLVVVFGLDSSVSAFG